jgi:hypothetical protein
MTTYGQEGERMGICFNCGVLTVLLARCVAPSTLLGSDLFENLQYFVILPSEAPKPSGALPWVPLGAFWVACGCLLGAS